MRKPPRLSLGLLSIAPLLLCPAVAAAQLRPIEPLEWRMMAAGPTVSAEVGVAVLHEQRAALAGTEGRLLEVGVFRAHWRTGRVLLEAGGTVNRFFRDDRRYAEPDQHVEPQFEGNRQDRGDYVAATTVRLTPEGAPLLGLVRFGTRLPTPDNRRGLERDMTDFFALAGARYVSGASALGVEVGVSINGTRDPEFEQKDVLAYAVVAELAAGPVTPSLAVVGHTWGPRFRELRGNESLGEVRAGVRTTGRRWLRAEAVAGYEAVSPAWGVRLLGGMDW